MKDDIITDWFGTGGPAPDPRRSVRMEAKAQLPRRFYKEAGFAPIEGGFVLTLDGRPARTPAKSPLATPTADAAEALAAEWAAQGETIKPGNMPLTRLVDTALDGVARNMAAVADEVGRYAGSDLLCYRAADPVRLVAREDEMWDPVLDWAHEAFGARFILAEGITFAQQPEASVAAIRDAVGAIDSPYGPAAPSTMTSLTGSVLLALAVAHKRLTATEAWAAAHVDEDFQMELWGFDDEALERRAHRWVEMEAAARLLASVSA